MGKLAFGLNIQKKPSSTPNKPPPGRLKPVFGGDSSEDEDDAAATGHGKPEDGAQEITTFDIDSFNEHEHSTSKPASHRPSKPSTTPSAPLQPLNSKPQPANAGATGETHRVIAEAQSVDPSIYDYDAAYDAIKSQRNAEKAAQREEARDRKPKYMDGLLASAETRKRDHLRAQDRLLQRERDAEGDEYADKEKFVTGAYKEQQEELRRVEEEEKKREEDEAEKRRGGGMTAFYKGVMEDDEKKHQAAVDAAARGKVDVGMEDDEEQDEDTKAAQLAKKMNEQGANVIINDEGEVADKRQLLSAGLNLAPEPKSKTPGSSQSRPDERDRPREQQQSFRGKSDAQRAMRERQTRMMEEQLEQASKRAAEQEAEEREKMERNAKSRKTEGEISSARERYLARKKEAAATAAAARAEDDVDE